MRTIRAVALTKDADLRDWFTALTLEGKVRLEARCTVSLSHAVSLAHDEDTRLVLLDDTAVENGSLAKGARRVRQAQRDLTVVCVISRPDSSVEVELRQMGILYIAIRPLDMATLDSVVRHALQTDTRKHYKPGTPPVGVPALSAEWEL